MLDLSAMKHGALAPFYPCYNTARIFTNCSRSELVTYVLSIIRKIGSSKEVGGLYQ